MFRSVRPLLILACLLSLALAASPVRAEPDKSLGLGLVMHDANGEPLAAFNLSSGCDFVDGGMACQAGFGPSRVELPFLQADLTGKAEVVVSASGVLVRNLTLSLPGARFNAAALGNGTDGGAAGEPSIVDLTVRGDGSYDPATGRLELTGAEVRLSEGSGPAAVLAGDLSLSADGLSVRLDADLRDPDRLLALLGPLVPEDFARAEFSGPLPLRLELDTVPGQALSGTLRLGLDKPVSLRLGPDAAYDLPPFDGRAALAEVQGGENGAGWSVKGSVDVGGKAGSGLLMLADSRLEFDLDQLERATVVRSISVRPAASSQLAVDRLGMSGTLRMPLSGPLAGGWTSQDLRLWLGPLPLSGQASMDANGTLAASLGASGLPLDRLAPMLSGIIGRDATLWGLTGTAGLSLNLVSGQGGTRGGFALKLKGAGFFDGQAMAGAQELDLDLRLNMASSPSVNTFSAKLGVSKGGFLYTTMFFDFANNPLTAEASGRMVGGQRVEKATADMDWQGFFKLAASGGAVLAKDGGADSWNLDLDLDDVALGPVFQTFVAAPQGLTSFQGEKAGLTGTAGARVTLANADGVTDLKGRVRLDGALANADGSLVIEDIKADLPLAYVFGGQPLKTSAQFLPPEAWGSLSLGAVRTPLVEIRPGPLNMAMAGNRLYVDGALDLPLYGGTISLNRVECDNPLSGDFLFLSDVRVKDLDLAELKGGIPLQGVLHGDLGRVSFSRQLLVVPGMLKGSFFGGDLSLWGVFMENPLADSRTFGLDLVIRGLDLEPLSQATDFGRVTGLMDVELRGLTVAYGEPVTMWLMARTPDNDDSSKTVSLKAVNSLSVLGTGSGIGDAGVGMFASFFEEFDYSKIGFLCELDNDRFKLSGLIREGGVEYLIKKPFLTGINVVNRSPDSTVSFRDMMERVERVVKDDSGNGPQIKMN